MIEFYAENHFGLQEIILTAKDLRFANKTNSFIEAQLIVTEVPNGQVAPFFARLQLNDAQSLLNALWKAGIRPHN